MKTQLDTGNDKLQITSKKGAKVHKSGVAEIKHISVGGLIFNIFKLLAPQGAPYLIPHRGIQSTHPYP